MTTETSSPGRVREAARNNAAWCAALCRAHGIVGESGPYAWTSPRRTPPYYPDAVTLTPEASPGDIVGRIDLTAPGASVKDSFAALDLADDGFEVLFEARWIHRTAPRATGEVWQRVRTEGELARWEGAWSQGKSEGLFPRGLLAEPGHTFLAARDARGEVVAGAVASRSGDVVGISNLYAVDGDQDAAWAGCLATAAHLWPGLPVVGYESGEDLDAALRAGFTPAGPLRVWLRRS
ncbi:hypothetical protein [Streptomyces sp. SDr-06]|uniref:hypothetical protein n=1 Tax=Streptomyces sp. SDr-06 TaxID=2267702 RepID=UPI001CB8A7DA|nr:hypothetical protein [Streptomyces sp. SDr-06]